MDGIPPVRRRLLGAALRRYRENLGYGLDEAARILECDRSKISRIETGQRGIRAKELRELLAEYGVAGYRAGGAARHRAPRPAEWLVAGLPGRAVGRRSGLRDHGVRRDGDPGLRADTRFPACCRRRSTPAPSPTPIPIAPTTSSGRTRSR